LNGFHRHLFRCGSLRGARFSSDNIHLSRTPAIFAGSLPAAAREDRKNGVSSRPSFVEQVAIREENSFEIKIAP